MPLGILEYRKLEHVPGTSPLSELGRSDVEVSQGIDPTLLKHDPSGTTVLVPQPSESPNDPYNWPRWKKEMFTLAIAYGCGCVGAVGPLLTSAFVPLAAKLNVPLARFTLGVNGSCIAAIAVGSILFNTLAVKIGKRPVYLISSVGLFVGCFWAAEAKSFASLSAARAVTGLCMAPMEALVPASIADIWFVHERGYRTAIFNLGVLGGINLASPIAGAIIQNSSYRVCLHAMGGAFVLQTLLTFLFMPESAFHRTGALNIDGGTHRVEVEGATEKGGAFEHRNDAAAADASDAQAADNGTNETPLTFAQSLMPYSGYWDRVSFWRTLLQPFFMLASPIVLWATLLFTTCISWLVLISITLSQIFSAPPYNFSVSSVGATNLSSFVATLLATAVAGPAIDGVVKLMSRKNGGTFEPEFRLPIMVTYLLFTASGFFAWGQSLYNQDSWAIPIIVCMGLINFGVQLGTTGVVAYVADSHRMQAAEAFAAMNFIKNMFAFGMTFYANDWIAVQGVRNCFFVIGGITVGATLTTIPMYVFGKKARGFTARHRLVKWIVDQGAQRRCDPVGAGAVGAGGVIYHTLDRQEATEEVLPDVVFTLAGLDACTMRTQKRSCQLPRHNGFAIRDIRTYFRWAFTTEPIKINRTHHGGQGGGCAGPPEAYTAHVDEAVLDDPVLPVLAAGRLFSEPDRKSGLLSVTTRLDCGQLVLCAALKDYWANKMQARAPTMDAIATITRQSNRATKPMSSPYAAEVLLYTGATRKLTGLSSIV